MPSLPIATDDGPSESNLKFFASNESVEDMHLRKTIKEKAPQSG